MTAQWLVPTLIYIAASGAVGVTSKIAMRHVRWQELILWTGIGYVLVGATMIVAGVTEVELVAGSGWAALTAAIAVSSLFMLFVGLAQGEAGSVVPVSAAYPVVTLVLAAIFLSESLTVAKAAGAALVIGGVVVLTSRRFDRTAARTPSHPDGVPGTAADTARWLLPTLYYVLGVGGLGITSKLALEHLRWPDLILWSSLGYAIVVVVLLARGDATARFAAGTGWTIVNAAAAIGGLIALYVALATGAGQASKVVPTSASYPAVTLILSAVFLGERVTAARALGVALVIGGVVVVTSA